MEGTTPDRILSRTLNILCGMCKSFFQSNDEIYNIGCGHLFHKTCLNTRPLEHPNCPQCGRPRNGSQQRIFLAFEEPSTVDDECLPYKWVPMKLGSNADSQLPPGAIECGTDDEGHKAYVARVIKGQELLPASYVPTKQAALASTCHVAYWITEDVEVLVLENCYHKWVAGQIGSYPLDALETGYSDTGEVTYTGRAIYRGILRIGKVHPSFHTMFVAHNQRERFTSHYEVLVITREKHIEGTSNIEKTSNIEETSTPLREPFQFGRRAMWASRYFSRAGCVYPPDVSTRFRFQQILNIEDES